MDPDLVLLRLHTRGALPDPRLIEVIRAKVRREERVECLIDNLSLRPDSAFTDLVEVLKETYQDHLSNLLTPPAGMPSTTGV